MRASRSNAQDDKEIKSGYLHRCERQFRAGRGQAIEYTNLLKGLHNGDEDQQIETGHHAGGIDPARQG